MKLDEHSSRARESARRPVMVYIMGRGFSGTTVLDGLLGNAPSIEGVGELVSGWCRLHDKCSCGAVLADCPMWLFVRESFERLTGIPWSEAGRDIQSQAIITRFIPTLLASRRLDWVERICTINDAVTETIAEKTGKMIVLDSSKEVTRALFLLRFHPTSLIIHIVRNPEAVLTSNLKRIKDGTGFKFMRRRFRTPWLAPVLLSVSAASWLIGNLLAELIAFRHQDRVLRVRFEDLCTVPRQVLQRIGGFLGCDLSSVIDAVEQGGELAMDHKIAGNRMRSAGTFVFDPARMEDRRLTYVYVILTRLITWPLMLRYGYFRRTRAQKTAPPETFDSAGSSTGSSL